MGKTLSQLAKNVYLTSKYGEVVKSYEAMDDWQRKARPYRCKLQYKGRQYSVDFFMGPANTGEPDLETVLDCLLSDAQCGDMSFDEFCGEFGYDTDSRKAETLHKQCKKIAEGIKQLLGDEYEMFLYADR